MGSAFNLNLAVGPLISGINPNQPVGVQISVGNTTAPDGSQVPLYATPGSLTASIGGTIVASIPDAANPTVLQVSAVIAGSLQVGDGVSGTDGSSSLPSGCEVLSQLTGAAGGTGTYRLNAGTNSGTLGSCEVTSVSTVLNVTAAAKGVPQPGQQLADLTGGLLPGTLITAFLSGRRGAPGLYAVNQPQTVAPETMTTSMTIVAQVQPLAASDLRHMDMLNLQGSHRAFYFNAVIRGIVRIALKGGDLLTLPDGSVWLVNQPLESFEISAGWGKVAATLQSGA